MSGTQLPVSFRRAQPADAASAARLLYETMGALGDYVFGQPGPEATIRFLARMFAQGGHRFSFTYSTLAFHEGAAVGLLQAIPGRQLWRCTLEIFPAIRRLFGLRFALGMIWRALPLAGEPDATDEEYYIEVLAVAPVFRNQGVGGSLLSEAERQAREAGYRVCSLGVFLENIDAKRLYERVGYLVERKIISRLRAPGVRYTGFYRMIKPLEDTEV